MELCPPTEPGGVKVPHKTRDIPETLEPVLSRVGLPVLEQLVAACSETVNLGILDGGEIVVINTVESPQAVRTASYELS